MAEDSISEQPALQQNIGVHSLQRGKERPLFREELRPNSHASSSFCHHSPTTRDRTAASRQIRPRSGELLQA
jgi:hypothetical protein